MRRQREKIVPLAQGRVLEVGMGSGLNLAHYRPGAVKQLVGVDPSAPMTRRALRAARAVSFPVALVHAAAERMPLASRSMDCAVLTYTLCSVDDPLRALREMARTLRPGGRLYFCEHGLAPDAGVRGWQRRLTPAWRRLAGGCHLDRDVPALLRRGGFEIARLESAYLPGWRPATFNYWGVAEPR